MERSITHKVGALTIPLPTAEDLTIFKAVAHRPRELSDIRAIINRQTNLDTRRIESWLREFAQLLEMPEIWDDIAVWLRGPG